MKKKALITLQFVIFAILATAGILYVLNKSPVEDLGTYEKQEVRVPNKDSSIVDQFFSPKSKAPQQSDDVSLMGGSSRYDEVRIGKSLEEE